MKRLYVVLGLTAALAWPAWADEETPGDAAAPTDIQQQILANPKALEKVLSMQDDPRMRSLLRDKRVMQAIKSGDVGALVTDPRIGELMKDPAVRSVAEEVGQ